MHNEVSYGTQAFYSRVQAEAIKLVLERGVSVSQVAKDLDIGTSVVGRWVRGEQGRQKARLSGPRADDAG
jgi:transposase-like protein